MVSIVVSPHDLPVSFWTSSRMRSSLSKIQSSQLWRCLRAGLGADRLPLGLGRAQLGGHRGDLLAAHQWDVADDAAVGRAADLELLAVAARCRVGGEGSRGLLGGAHLSSLLAGGDVATDRTNVR